MTGDRVDHLTTIDRHQIGKQDLIIVGEYIVKTHMITESDHMMLEVDCRAMGPLTTDNIEGTVLRDESGSVPKVPDEQITIVFTNNKERSTIIGEMDVPLAHMSRVGEREG